MWYKYSPLLYWANMVVWPHLLPLTNTCKHDFLGTFDPLGNLMWKNDTRDTFAILCKYGSLTTFATLNKYMQTWFFDYIWSPGQLCEKMILEIHLLYCANMVVWPHLLPWTNTCKHEFFLLHLIPWAIMWKNDTRDTFAILCKYGSLTTFATLNKYMQTWFFGYIWSPGQLCEKMILEIHLLYCANMVVWPHLLPWTNTCKHDFLGTFDPLGNLMWKNDTWDTFAILCKYGSLTTFATLNKYMQTWFFDYIWSPGQLCEKMILEIHLLYCANMVVWPHLLPWTNTCKHEFFYYIWSPGQLCEKMIPEIHLLYWANMVVWPHLLPWTNVWKHKFCFGGQLCARITFVLHLLQWAKSYKTVFF